MPDKVIKHYDKKKKKKKKNDREHNRGRAMRKRAVIRHIITKTHLFKYIENFALQTLKFFI